VRKFFAGVAGFVLGVALGYCVILFGWVAYMNVFDIIDREGAMTMGFAFTIGPIGAVLSGIFGAIWFARRAGRAQREAAP
jgi:hypothetical protein